MHNLVLTREVIINAMFPVDRMRELIFAIGKRAVRHHSQVDEASRAIDK